MKFETACDIALRNCKTAYWFPFDTGRLKFNATSGQLMTNDIYVILIDGEVSPYAEYLEDGTKPHNIPRAFGRDLPFGTYGRFDGKFHPGSTKHKGWISNKMVNTVINSLCLSLKGELK